MPKKVNERQLVSALQQLIDRLENDENSTVQAEAPKSGEKTSTRKTRVNKKELVELF